MGGQVGEPVRGHLVGHGEQVDQVLDREVPVLLRADQDRRGRRLRHEDRGGEVVRFDPLPQEVGEVPRHLVAEQEVAEGLQHDRPRRVRADRLLLDVDPPVPQVGQGAHRPRQVLDVADGEAVVAHHRDQHALGQRAARVPARPQRAGRLTLDGVEVVTPLAHGIPQRRVGGPGLLGGGGRLGPLRPQFRRDRDQVLEHLGGHPGADPQLRQAQAPVGRVLLRVGQGDLELRAAAGRLTAQQLGGRHRKRRGQLLDQGELRLSAAVLKQRKDRGSAADPLPQLGERQAPRAAQVPQPLAERQQGLYHRSGPIFHLFIRKPSLYSQIGKIC